MRSLVICIVLALVASDFRSASAHEEYLEQSQSDEIYINMASKGNGNDPAKRVDHLILVLNWGPAGCLSGAIDCRREPKPKFTIHGFWAQQSPRSQVINCKHEPYDPRVLRPIMQDMQNFWPSLNGCGDESFWRHEWNKHGGCAMVADGVTSLFTYFRAATQLYRKLRIHDALKAGKFFPTSEVTYWNGDIRNVISDMHGARVNLGCFKHQRTGDVYLTDVFVCYDKHLNPMNCPKSGSRCDSHYLILSDSAKRIY